MKHRWWLSGYRFI